MKIASPVEGRFDAVLPGEVEQRNAAVDGVLENALHIVVFGLGKLNSGEGGNGGEKINVVISPAAEMNDSSAEFIQKKTVEREGEFPYISGERFMAESSRRTRVPAYPQPQCAQNRPGTGGRISSQRCMNFR